jgi:hypothetical protein
MTDALAITVVVRATPTTDNPWTAADLGDAVRATLHEVFPGNGDPVVPEVEVVAAVEPRMVPLEEAARLLDPPTTSANLRQAAARGSLATVKVGRDRFVTLPELYRYAEQNRRPRR